MQLLPPSALENRCLLKCSSGHLVATSFSSFDAVNFWQKTSYWTELRLIYPQTFAQCPEASARPQRMRVKCKGQWRSVDMIWAFSHLRKKKVWDWNPLRMMPVSRQCACMRVCCEAVQQSATSCRSSPSHLPSLRAAVFPAGVQLRGRWLPRLHQPLSATSAHKPSKSSESWRQAF